MVAAIINAVVASQVARGEAEAPPEEVPHIHPHAREPLDALAKEVMQDIEAQRRGAGR